MRAQLSLFVLFFLMFQTHAFASVKIGQMPAYSDLTVDSVTYEVNEPIGRARVHVEFSSESFATWCPSDDCNNPYDDEQFLVPGLSYHALSQVVYTDPNGKTTVCAELATQNWVNLNGKYTYFKPTGNCEVSLQKENQLTDDGFNRTTVLNTAVFFEAK